MKKFSTILKLVFSLMAFAMLFSCMAMPIAMPAGPEPGTKGFYEIDSVEGRVETENVEAVRLSSIDDTLFVYRVDNDKVVIGHNKVGDAAVKPLDQISSGVVITNDAANRLASYLDSVIAEYDGGDKTNSKYKDFRFLMNGTIEVALTEEVIEIEEIMLRFQYFFNNTEEEDEEITICYLGGKVEELTYADLQALVENLRK